MGMLAIAALVWVGAHLGIAGTGVRRAIAGRIGDGGFRAVFSLVSFGAILWLIASYRRAETTLLWTAPAWLRGCIVAVMLVACVLLVASVAAPNPTAVGGESALGGEPRGILRVTRHPMLWAFTLWAGAHMLGNGDTASLLFFGAFLVTALAGMPSIDAKVARRDPRNWPVLAAGTSILPFGAIAAGRNRLAPGEIGWWCRRSVSCCGSRCSRCIPGCSACRHCRGGDDSRQYRCSIAFRRVVLSGARHWSPTN